MADKITDDRTRSLGAGWMMTYASLLTAVLAFFILFVTRAEHEAATTFKFSERIKNMLYSRILEDKESQRLDWLYVENTGTKGIKLLIPSRIGKQPMFPSEDDKINPLFIGFLETTANIIKQLELEKIQQTYRPIIEALEKSGKKVTIELTVEGHTDYLPVLSGRFKTNWDLSLARSYQVMKFLQSETALPKEYFSLAGYGSFHPLRSRERLDENRRVEIYIDVQLIEVTDRI